MSMGFDPKRYPKNWPKIVARIRHRAGDQCECTGECGLHKTNPGPRRCIERHGEPAKWAKGKIVLTTAHLDYEGGPCQCEKKTGKKCGNPKHLKSMCQRCHLRIDIKRHIRNAKAAREKKKWRDQLALAL